MASIFPFRALRYNTRKAGELQTLVTQPYDKITPEMLERYQALSPYNLSWIIKTTDYEKAGQRLRQWMDEGIVQRDHLPAIYPYFQEYQAPGRGERLTRRGFIAAGMLQPYEAGVVFRHEQTLTGPKQDRLALLRATRVHFGQIFVLYSDPQGQVDVLLEEATGGREPIECVCDEYGVEHRVWRANTPARLAAFRRAMAGKKLIIADGHHRYETALAFRDECRAASPAGSEAAAGGPECQPACDAVMMTFVSMEQAGLTILPTHRLLRRFPAFERARFLEALAHFFEAQPAPVEQGRAALAAAPAGQAIGLALRTNGEPEFVILRLKSEVRLEELLPGLSAAQRALDVVVLHDLLFKQCLNISEEAVREEKFLEYVREFESGWQAVRAGAPACFFLNPVRVEQVRDIALAGQVMPQKSTDFYPKLLSGLTGYEV